MKLYGIRTKKDKKVLGWNPVLEPPYGNKNRVRLDIIGFHTPWLSTSRNKTLEVVWQTGDRNSKAIHQPFDPNYLEIYEIDVEIFC